jgi:hypothetical protein
MGTMRRMSDALARALHDWRKTQSLAGCGWRFASVVDGEVLCPCPADAAAILVLLGEGDRFAEERAVGYRQALLAMEDGSLYGPWRDDPSDAGREVRRRRRAQAVNDEVVERLDQPGNRANLDAPTPEPLGERLERMMDRTPRNEARAAQEAIDNEAAAQANYERSWDDAFRNRTEDDE